jgi:hypothetical protein
VRTLTVVIVTLFMSPAAALVPICHHIS